MPRNAESLRPLERAWFQAPVSRFLGMPDAEIIGHLAVSGPHPVDPAQADAWTAEIVILKQALDGLGGHLLLEFEIPRMGRRIDAVLIVGHLIVVIEFKVGSDTFDRSAIEQVWDYALDLKNFHGASHDFPIVPLLVATEAHRAPSEPPSCAADGVYHPILSTSKGLRAAIDERLIGSAGASIDVAHWVASPYRPTPTIIEAAKALYARHSVEAIARYDAGAANLRVTSQRVEDLIDDARRNHRKLIIFVTGVPGAGKTLVGLNVATKRRDEASPSHAVFLSGNGPLVSVLRAALTRDAKERRRRLGRQGAADVQANPVKAFIQNVHHFRDEALRDIQTPPNEHVAIFDEAQRAWNLTKTADFMKKRKQQPNFSDSEPAFLIRYMDRHSDWSVIVCLVGGGQEIHTGEAGISEWLTAATTQFPGWELHISPRLTDSEYAAGQAVDMVKDRPRTCLEADLHLAVSMRSFRAENLSSFVKAVLDHEVEEAHRLLCDLGDRYPLFITRDLDAAKAWVRARARGSERFGMLASSKALRLRPHAIDVRAEVDPVHWFLDDRDDIRSSCFLEDCATEFQVQGLELDWTIVTWDADLRCDHMDWTYHDFRGKRWQVVRAGERKKYLKNAYRVLLTRARQGMVIFIPPGNVGDRTRPPEFYDSTFEYLSETGIPRLSTA
jgi:hypothetical protein